MSITLHPLSTNIQPPSQFTYPFCYEPHPLCRLAAAEVQRHIVESGVWSGEKGVGKMFGVLVVQTVGGKLAFLAAYSGLLAGRNDWEYFVPPVFDAQRPDGHFKQTERDISAINSEIAAIKSDPAYMDAIATRGRMSGENAETLDRFRMEMEAAKARRDKLRQSGKPIDSVQRDAMTRESQYMKAELRRRRKEAELRMADYDTMHIKPYADRIASLQQRRRQMSDELQLWLFSQYRMLNALGERRDLIDIFRSTIHAMPPAGSGDCCAPKLLQYAFANRLKPVCMAEFWWGESPKQEIRHHLHYYPACRSKCLPILTHMLVGLDVEPNPLASAKTTAVPEVVYADDDVVVVDKPSGMLSVPGKQDSDGNDSPTDAETYINTTLHTQPTTFKIRAVHRLDMDTSGLLVLARTASAYSELQRQFAARETSKCYEAILDGVAHAPADGTISIPLRADITDRPRQCADYEHGKEATTIYHIEAIADGKTLIRLHPLTGRTHQLRMHCALADGLATPILGDPLYGRGTKAPRMYLHAVEVEFNHPTTGRRMAFKSESKFNKLIRKEKL